MARIVKPQSEFNVEEAKENGLTLLKMRSKSTNACAQTACQPASGWVPGIEVIPKWCSEFYSARFAGGTGNNEANKHPAIGKNWTASLNRTHRIASLCFSPNMRHEEP